jgi:hypothetical protein
MRTQALAAIQGPPTPQRTNDKQTGKHATHARARAHQHVFVALPHRRHPLCQLQHLLCLLVRQRSRRRAPCLRPGAAVCCVVFGNGGGARGVIVRHSAAE